MQAQTAYQRNDFEGSVALCRKILDIAPRSFLTSNLLAASLHRTGKVAGEIDAVESALREHPDSLENHAILGELHRTEGNIPDAVTALEKAAAGDPENPIIHFNLGRAKFDGGDNEGAEAAFNRSLELAPGFPKAHYFLGKVHWRARDIAKAKAAYTAAIKVNPDFAAACVSLADLLYRTYKSENRAEELAQAADLAGRAIRAGARSFRNYLLAGKILVELERYEDALKFLEPAAQYRENHPDLYIALSNAYIWSGHRRKAQSISRRLMREFPIASRRCAAPEAEVLVLEALNNTAFIKPRYGSYAYAQTNTIGSLPPHRVSLHHTFVEGVRPEALQEFKDKYGVIYNNVANAELNIERGYGRKAHYVYENAGLPVVNRPDRIDLTTRDNNYRRLHGTDHLIFPKTVKLEFDAESVDETVGRVEEEFQYPLLLRRAGLHRADSRTGVFRKPCLGSPGRVIPRPWRRWTPTGWRRVWEPAPPAFGPAGTGSNPRRPH